MSQSIRYGKNGKPLSPGTYPTKPMEPVKPVKSISGNKKRIHLFRNSEESNSFLLKDIEYNLPKGYTLSDVCMTIYQLEDYEQNIEFSINEPIDNSNYSAEMVKYKDNMKKYKEKMKKYNDKLKEWKLQNAAHKKAYFESCIKKLQEDINKL